ncbi:hypothetical protein B0O80DRAFT_271209 [Mortierella sp. GBAus27b]|nr:hypothetical protein B0O80DRAFT_271209 [Mortierella sp. GBAus27b]
MFIYFMVHPQEVFSMPAQALDLCLRLTACPIFSLPPPPFLLRYFHKKYGSTVRDDNPNTMIEEGITNNPRPRRPPLLVSHPTSYHSRRGSDFDLDYPTYPGMRSLSLHLPFPGFDDIQCKRFMDEEANIGTSSTLGTDTSPRLRPLSTNSSSFHKEAQTPTTAVGDDSIHTAVSVIPPLDAQSTSSTHGTTPPSPPSTFSPGTTQDRDEDEETAIAARNISRRLTMEGRRDGLDFLNIGNFIKWPHRSHSPVPEPKATLAGPSGFSTFGPLPTITPGSSPLNPNRNRSGPRSLSPSEPSRVSDICIREEDEFTDHTPWRYGPDGRLEDPSVHEDGSTTQDNEKEARRRTMDTLESLNDDLSEIHTEGHDDDAQVRSRASNATLNEDDDSHDGSSSSRVPAIGRRLSMENIRQMSRHALTRFHAGPIRTGLSISTPSTGPLSPTILRTNHGTNNSNGSDESRLNSPKSVSSNHGSDALEPIPNYQQQQQQQQQHTRSQQTHAVEPIVNPLNEESS